MLYLALTSRVTDDPISVAMKGVSSAGKSRQVATVLEFFPEEAFLDLTAMTARALAYSNDDFAHRCVVLYEAHGGEDASYFIRTLQSEGQIKLATVEKTPLGMQTRIIVRPGPTNFVTTTTSPTLHDENETRQWSLTVDESPEQTRAVMRRTAERFAGVDPGPPPETWLALQRWLGELGVTQAVIPYAGWLADRLPDHPLRLRRDFGRLLALIEVIALLYQRQRERDPLGRVIATAADYAMAATLLGDIVPQATGGLAPKTRHLVSAAAALHAAKGDLEATVSVIEVMMSLGESTKMVTRWLGPALAAGAVVDVGPGGKGQAWRLRPGAEMRDTPGLPDPAALAVAFPHLVAPCIDPLTGEEKTWPVVSRNTGPTVPVGPAPPGAVGHQAANWDSPARPPPLLLNPLAEPELGRLGQWDRRSDPTPALFGDTVGATCLDCGELLPAHRSYRCLACTAVAG